MATRKLAKELGLLRQHSQSTGQKKPAVSNQIFSYLIVIDFESTCWREKNNYTQEIIEFPAVLLNTSTGEVESEFHTYVQPQERPILSEFCTELTGITQMQVEAGIPLHICLSRFSRWLQNLQLRMGVVFPNKQQRCSEPSASPKLCTFLTWSDWDLGVCLQYECKRKQIHKPDVLNSWIDLRSTYRLFYNRKPKGLNGALQDLGIQFSGREHSGVDDARNTAQLAARMMRDGCVMKITRSLDRTPSTVKPVFGNSTRPSHTTEKAKTDKEESTSTTNKPSTSKIPVKSGLIKLCTKSNTEVLNTNENAGSVQESVQNLISPKTLLNGSTTQLWGRNRKSVTAEVVTNLSSSVMTVCPSPHINKNNNNNGLVMFSTTMGRLSHLPRLNQTSRTAGFAKDEEVAELIVETEDRCGSYDDVVLEGEDTGVETGRELEYVSDFDDRCYESEGQVTLRDNIRETVSAENKTQRIQAGESSTMSDTTKRLRSHVNMCDQFNKMKQRSTMSEPEVHFAVPKTVIWSSKSNQQKSRVKTPQLLRDKPHVSHENCKINTPSMFRLKPFASEKTSTPNNSFAKTKHTETLKSSFSIYTDSVKQAPSSHDSLNVSKNILSSLSTNTLSSSTNRSYIPVMMMRGGGGGGGKITAPLCSCGRRAKRQVVSNGGPNHGRGFYCCAVRRSGSGISRIQKGCEFFKWESSLMKSSSAAAVVSPAVRSSVSLCHFNSTLSCRPPQGSSLRKSY